MQGMQHEAGGSGRLVGHRRSSLITQYSSLLLATLLTASGCDTTKSSSGGGSLFQREDGRERWAIRAYHSSSEGHAQQAATLADLLKKVQGLDAGKVRLVSNAESSTIYYGEYVKVAASNSDKLVFPAEYQKDFTLIRHLVLGQSSPFALAEPEILQPKKGDTVRDEYDVANAKGAYTLQIAVFYNTPQFTQREEGARQYVLALRQEGHNAYYSHGPLKSIVYVGDFEASDLVQGPQGAQWGPRIEEFVKRNEAEFRHMSENGQLIKRVGIDGTSSVPLSILVPVPKTK